MSKNNKTINNISDFVRKIRDINSVYLSEMLDLYGDYGRMLRVYTAKILLFFTFYNIFLLLPQITPSLSSFAFFILFGVIIDTVPKIIGDDMPPVISYIYKGEFFNDFSLKMLNWSIGLLFMLSVAFVALQKTYVIGSILKKNYANK